MNCPSFLPKEAKLLWNKVKTPLLKSGLLNEVTAPLVAAVCCHWHVYLESYKTLERDGRTVSTAGGSIKLHPLCQVEKTAYDSFVKGLRNHKPSSLLGR